MATCLIWTAAGNAVAGEEGTVERELRAEGATILLRLDPAKLELAQEEWVKWISDAAISVRTYYGEFPVARLQLRLTSQPGRGVVTGATFGFPPFTRVIVGERTSVADLRRDWVMTHEMVHLAFPSVGDEHHWIEEGIATYVEPIARAQAGQIDSEEVWRQLVDGLPKGLPASGDRGLDHTHTWGRTYWGGALYCLLADIKIREQTRNQKGLQDALRGIVHRGGSIEAEWPLRRVLDIADAATGTTAMSGLYLSMRAAPVQVDLDALWRKLGVRVRGERITYEDDAPMAGIRRAITERRSGEAVAPD